MSRIPILTTAAMLFYVLVCTSFWGNTEKAFRDDGLSYAQRRINYGFNGFPIDELAAKIDSILPLGTPVSIGPSLAKSDFISQRIAEGLYPRTVDLSSPYQLDGTPSQALPQKSIELFRSTDGSSLILRNVTSETPRAATKPSSINDSLIIVVYLLAALTSALGFGMLARCFFARATSRSEKSTAEAILAGIFAIGLIYSVQTWLQLALPAWFWMLIGAVLAGAFGYTEIQNYKWSLPRPKAETIVFTGVLIVFCLDMFLFPIALWDGRSVWFFAAKKIFYHGFLAKADLLNSSYQFSNPSYPALVPAWLSYCTALSPQFNERLAAQGHALFFVTLLSLFWIGARERLGRWPGALTTFAVFFMLQNLTIGGYVDQFVALLLLLAVVSFSRPNSTHLAWLALLVCSLIKIEGLVFSVIAALILGRRQLFAFVLFLPAVFHRGWTQFVGVQNIFQEAQTTTSDILNRLVEFMTLLPTLFEVEGYTQSRFVLRLGFVCGVTTIIWIVISARRSIKCKTALATLLLSSVTFIISAFVTATVPFDVKWFFGVTVDRLLLTPSLLAMAALLFCVKPDHKQM